MNWDIIQGNWTQFKGEMQSKWGEITDDELDQAKGERDRLVGLIQERYGLAKSDAETEIDKLVGKLSSAA